MFEKSPWIASATQSAVHSFPGHEPIGSFDLILCSAELSRLNSDDFPIFQHKTTLGEAEIQSAVEAAAVIFKKVVLQRRQAAKKATDDGE